MQNGSPKEVLAPKIVSIKEETNTDKTMALVDFGVNI